jgi:hypothetical protein
LGAAQDKRLTSPLSSHCANPAGEYNYVKLKMLLCLPGAFTRWFERILARLPQVEFSDERIEIMAKAAHEAFCRGMASRGFQYGPQMSEQLKTHPALVAYERLPEDLKEASRATVRDIPRKLRLLGYHIEASDDSDWQMDFTTNELDQLAQLEHQRWMKHRYEGGWIFGAKTDPDRKIHASLVGWDELSEQEREKDREMIRSIPSVLAEAGFMIVKE